jgi:steroid 5-alpha reductase family enzyme
MEQLLLGSLWIIVVYATFWFIVSLIIKRNDFADVAWGLWYIVLCIYYFSVWGGGERAVLMYGLVAIRGIRLAVTIFLKNRKKKEDFRYAQRRKDRGKYFYIRSYLQVYLLQWLLMGVIIFPVLLVSASSASELHIWDWIGILVWILWFIFESVGDWQLAQFKKDSSNTWKILNTGLWKYSRHPNYFGEVVMRWAIFIIGLSATNWIYGIISPLMITFLILYVSWVPLLEKKYDWNPEYEIYKKKTSMFIPLPPKKI